MLPVSYVSIEWWEMKSFMKVGHTILKVRSKLKTKTKISSLFQYYNIKVIKKTYIHICTYGYMFFPRKSGKSSRHLPTLSPKNTGVRSVQTLFSRRITAEAARQLTVTEP